MARPKDLVDVPESGYIASEGTRTASNRPSDLIDIDPDYVSQQINPYNTVTGVATGAAVLAPAIEKKILGTDPRAGRSLETYLRTQRHHEYPGLDLKGLQTEWQKIAGPNARIVTMQDVQEALKATRPVDLSTYKTAPKPTTAAGKAVQPVKKLGEAVEQLNPFLGQGYGSRAFRGAGRAGLGFGAAYEGAQAYNKALEGDVAGAAGSASTSAGLGLMAVPHPVAKGAGAILAGVPLASNLIGSANAGPMTKEEASGTAFDIATGLLGPLGLALTPSELGHGTLTKRNEASRPGKSVLEGSRLPPQGYAEGKSVQGSESNAAPFIGYPHIKNKPRDPNFVQQSGPILGGLDAIIGMGKRDDVSVLTPEGRAYNEFYDKYEPIGIAASVLPFMGGPAKAVGKSAAKNLGPRAADMTENYLSKIGGVQYAVPPGKQSTFAQPTPLKSKPQKFSEAIEPFIGTHSLHPTIVDKTKLDLAAGRMAGPEAPYLQEISQPHKESGWIFANDSLNAASKLYNMGKDNKTLVTGLLGSPTQLKTNRSVFGEIADEYFKAIKEGKMTPELQAKIQARLPTLTHGKENLQTFPTQFDIRDRDAFNEMSKGFHQRGHLADIMGGKGVSQGLPRGTAKIIPYEDILMRNTEESLLGAPTHSIGSRLFTVGSKPPEYRPDLHNAFDYANFGELKSGHFGYVPKEVGYPDEIARIKANLASRGIGRDITAMDLMRNTINQPITEQMWRRAQAEGYAPGGKVLSAIKKLSEEAQAAYKAKFTPGFYHGSPSNEITAFDASKGDKAFPTEGVTFATRNPKFADGFLDMHRNKAGGFDYNKGSTTYPININLGKHFVPGSPEGSALIDQYISKMPVSPDAVLSPAKRAAALKSGAWDVMEDPKFLQHLQDTGHDTFTVMEGGVPNVGVFNPANIRGKFAKYNPEDAADPDFMKAKGGPVQHFQVGKRVLQSGLDQISKLARHPHGQDPKVAQALEEYLKGNISQEERIRIANQFLPIRQWNELPPNYTDEQIRNALTSDKQAKALAPVPVGMRVGNRLDIPAYTQKGVYVDTTHDTANKPISYGRTGHLKDVAFSSSPDTFVRVGLGTKEQALTPLGAQMGTAKTPKALIKGIHQGTPDDEVRRMMEEMMKDPRYTQIGMDPRKHSQFYDKSTGMPVFSAEEKLQSGPLILAPKKGLETTSWDDPRLNLTDFPGKKYKKGGKVKKK